MVVLSLSPALGWMGGLAAMVIGAVIALLAKEEPLPHDPEREYRRLQFKVRHPWKARLARWTGVD